MRDSKPLLKLLQKQKEEGRIYVAICASPAVVFAVGHVFSFRLASPLAGRSPSDMLSCFSRLSLPTRVSKRRLTSMWMKRWLCLRTAVRIPVLFHLVTSQGPGTVIEFALQLVESLCGKATRNSVAKGMIFQLGV